MRASLPLATLLVLTASLAHAQAQQPPRGLAPLGILHAAYAKGGTPGRAALTSMREILAASPNPEVAVLFTTFSTTYKNAGALVRPLIKAGKAPVVTIYLLNGPGRRNNSRLPHIDFRTDLRPDAFNRKLRQKSDQAFFKQLDAQILAPTRAFLDRLNGYATKQGQPLPRFVLIPELEDNFGAGKSGKAAFRSLLQRTRAAMAGLSNVSYRRNPLTRGSNYDAYRIKGIPLEAHSNRVSTLAKLKRGDTVTGDGAHFRFPGESGSPPITPNEPVSDFKDMRALFRAAKTRGIGVLLWRAEWQGLAPNASGNPDRRRYSFPASGSDAQKKMISLMKRGAGAPPPVTPPPVTPPPATPPPATPPPATPPKGKVTEIRPRGTSMDGANEFVWKPKSDGDGKVVVLAPTRYTGKIKSARLVRAKGKVVEQGRATGVANGGREHFRFRRTGTDYPRNLWLELELKRGATVRYLLPMPGKRYD